MHEEDQGGGSNPGRCMACKYLRRRCAPDCMLTSYFPVSQPSPLRRRPPGLWRQQSRKSLPVDERAQAAETMAMEAQWLVEDPVYGFQPTQCKLTRTRAQLAIVPVHAAARQRPPRPRRVDARPRQGKAVPLLDPDDGHRFAVAQMQGQGEAVPLLDRPEQRPPRRHRAGAEAGRGGDVT
ncbi:hypothetical protein VPH35_089021 [Triticum aestivum]